MSERNVRKRQKPGDAPVLNASKVMSPSLFGAAVMKQRSVAVQDGVSERGDKFNGEHGNNHYDDRIVNSNGKEKDNLKPLYNYKEVYSNSHLLSSSVSNIDATMKMTESNHDRKDNSFNDSNWKNKSNSNNSNSNSGFAILRVLDNMTNFASSTIPEEGNGMNERTTESASSSVLLDDWRQTDISLSRCFHSSSSSTAYIGNIKTDLIARPCIGITDWSLKRGIKIECHPGHILQSSTCPGIFSSVSLPLDRQCAVDQVAKQLLSIHGPIFEGDHEHHVQHNLLSSLLSDEERAAALWISGTHYWQHPTQHPLPSKILSNGLKGKSFSLSNKLYTGLSNTTGSMARGAISSIGNALRKSSLYQRVRAAGHGSLGGLGSSAENKVSFNMLISSRQREWAESFRSMYLTWLGKLYHINACDRISREQCSTQGNLPCFYALSPGRTILFRYARKRSLHKLDNDSVFTSVSDDMYVPLIIISSSSEEFRIQLRSMGVKITLTSGKEFLEPTDGENEEYIKEVEALRQSSTAEHGGLQVDVKRVRTTKVYPSKEESTIVISGMKDCQIFFEIFCGSYGSLYIGRKGEMVDVPLLLTRTLGPCLNTCLKQLVVSERQDGDKSSQDNYASVDLRGKCRMTKIMFLAEILTYYFILKDQSCHVLCMT